MWNEGDGGQGDAGTKPATANVTTGGGPLDTICGSLPQTNTGADFYEIMVIGPTFSATVTDRANSTLDPEVYLFDVTGRGLYANDNENGSTTDAQILNVTLTPGIYFLAIAPTGQEALNKNGVDIFDPVTGSTTLLTPTATPKIFKSWSDTGNSSGKYVVSLVGAGFAATPEPATLALVGGALLGLAALRRRI